MSQRHAKYKSRNIIYNFWIALGLFVELLPRLKGNIVICCKVWNIGIGNVYVVCIDYALVRKSRTKQSTQKAYFLNFKWPWGCLQVVSVVIKSLIFNSPLGDKRVFPFPIFTCSVLRGHCLGADGSIRDGRLWKFLTVRQIYMLSNQS